MGKCHVSGDECDKVDVFAREKSESKLYDSRVCRNRFWSRAGRMMQFDVDHLWLRL